MTQAKHLLTDMSIPEGLLFKVTTSQECHHGVQYKTGLVEDHLPFARSLSCVPGGLYFTTRDAIFKHYHRGVWIRQVTLPTDREGFLCAKDPGGDEWRANMLILGERHSLGDLQTYSKWNLVTMSVEQASQYGFIEVLDWWLVTGLLTKYDHLDARHIALYWWRWSDATKSWWRKNGPLSDAALQSVEAVSSHCLATICAPESVSDEWAMSRMLWKVKPSASWPAWPPNLYDWCELSTFEDLNNSLCE